MLRYLELTFLATPESDSRQLPPFLGATLRGALGHLLKELVCQMDHGACDRCLLASACAYPRVFEGLPLEQGATGPLRSYSRLPQPLVLLVPAPQQRPNCPQEPLRWGIRLFGDAAGYWPYLVHVFREAGRRGIGSGRVRYRLDRVEDGEAGDIVWDGHADEVVAEPTVRHTGEAIATASQPRRLRWRFLTPVRLREGGREVVHAFDPLSLVLAGRRRWRLFEQAYGEGRARHEGVHVESADFEVVHSSLRPWSMTRYSGRQRRRMQMRGLLGEAVVEGPWDQAGPWLAAVPKLHVGKATTFGFGRVTWEPA